MEHNELFTLQTLAEFYTKAAKAGGVEICDFADNKWFKAAGPNLNSLVGDYRPKPAKKKIIDLQPLLASGIDCEFKDAEYDTWRVIGPLSCTFSTVKSPYQRKTSTVAWEQCRPRMDHTMFHNGGECPLPEGFEVQLSYCKGVACNTSDYTSKRWNDVGNNADIIGYKILGLADGYAYPWEQAE